MVETFNAIKSFCLDVIEIVVAQIPLAKSHLSRPRKYAFFPWDKGEREKVVWVFTDQCNLP